MTATILTLQNIPKAPLHQKTETKSRTLQDELKSRGIPVIAFKQVHAHQHAALCALRPGIWRLIAPLFRLFFNLCGVLWGVTLSKEWSKYSAKKVPTWMLALPVIVVMSSFLGIIFSLMAGIPESIFGWLTLPLSAFLITIFFIRVEYKNTRLAQSTSAWVMGRINIRGYSATQEVPLVPPHLRPRISKAGTIPQARLYVEYLQEDPFVVVVRTGNSSLLEKVYIGAWETGNHEFDHT